MSYINIEKYKSGMSPAYLAEPREKFFSLPYLTPRLYKNACRYKRIRRIRDDATKKIYHETWNQVFVAPSEEDQYHTVDIHDANRLDMIASHYYGSPNYWWVIALANYIIDPFDVPRGSYLRIPPILSLYNNGGVLDG